MTGYVTQLPQKIHYHSCLENEEISLIELNKHVSQQHFGSHIMWKIGNYKTGFLAKYIFGTLQSFYIYLISISHKNGCWWSTERCVGINLGQADKLD